MTPVNCLVVAKAPVPGQAKTRLGREIGDTAAAEVAAAALLDTLDACRDAFPTERCHLALTGDLAQAAAREEIEEALGAWRVFAQRGESFSERLAHAHADVGEGPVLQIGMDTPQVTGPLLAEVAAELADHEGLLGPAADGGWWVLALRDPKHAAVLADVPASTPDTGVLTWEALCSLGLDMDACAGLRDVDTAEDAAAVAREAADGRFARAWSRSSADVIR